MMDLLEEVRLNEEKDEFVWILGQSKSYSTRSMYRRLTCRGMTNMRIVKSRRVNYLINSKLFYGRPHKADYKQGWISKEVSEKGMGSVDCVCR